MDVKPVPTGEHGRQEAHGATRAAVAELIPPVVPAPKDDVTVADRGDRSVVVVSGDTLTLGGEVASALHHLDPREHPCIVLDLRDVTRVNPLLIHALLRAWERRNRQFGAVRVLVSPGPARDYLVSLRLEHAFEVICVEDSPALPAKSWELWRRAQYESIEHYNHLLSAVMNHDLPEVKRLGRKAHPLCVVAGAAPDGGACGKWCSHCPLLQQYGGCHPVIDRIIRDSAGANWDASQHLVHALIAEVVRFAPPAEKGASSGR